MKALVSGLAVTVVAAATSAGCSGNDVPKPRAILLSNVQPGANGAEKCQISSAVWLDIGAVDAPVEDGAADQGRSVGVSCSVTTSGDGFQVAALAKIPGAGSVGIAGKFTSSGTQTGITGTFFSSDGRGQFIDNNCTVTYDAGTPMGVAAGRVWGRIDCPKMVDNDKNRACEGLAEFRFENCAQ